MKHEIEIEFKNILTPQEFSILHEHFQFKDQDYQTQTNYYFETELGHLREKKAALRIREKSETYTLTLKEQKSDGVHEHHIQLSYKEAQEMITKGPSDVLAVKQILNHLSIPLEQLKYLGFLKTHRAKKAYKNGIIFLDRSDYFHVTDYEVEYEVTDEELGKEIFRNLLLDLNIEVKVSKSKIARFYQQLVKSTF